MAQHQLMLLVLSVIVVGVSLILGITTYTEDKKKFERDTANTALIDLAGKAIAYRRTPESMDGGTKADGSSSFAGFTMDAIGSKKRTGEGGGYDLLGDGSCFTGHPTPDGAEFKAAWYPKGDCETSNNIVLNMTITGSTLSSVTIENGGYAQTWFDTE